MNTTRFLTCLIQANHLVKLVKSCYPDCESAYAGDEPPDPGTASADMFRNLTPYLPELIAAANAGVLPTALAQFEANRAIAPRQAELESGLYAQYGPEVAATQAKIKAAQDLAASESQLSLSKNPCP